MGIDLDELLAGIKEAPNESLKPICASLVERFGVPSVGLAFAMANEGGASENPFKAGLISASEMPPTSPLNPFWFGLYPGRVTLLIGETGAGKSSLLLNIAVNAALGNSLWDFDFSRPLRTLYVDPENSGNYRDGEREGGLCGLKLERIGLGKPDNLDFHDGRGVDLSKETHLSALRDLICEERHELVILDPISNLCNTKDENSNSEVALQGKALTALSRETGACIVIAHHTGKDTTGNYGRGASARLAAADVGMVFRARASEESADDTYTGQTRQRRDICRLQIAKDRPNFFGQSSRYLRMAGDDRFDLATFEEWKPGEREAHPDKATLAEDEIMLLLQDGEEHSRKQIQETMQAEGFGRTSIDSALKNLESRTDVTVTTRERGAKYYQIARENGAI